MTDPQLIETTQNYLRLALPMMSKYKVPITPENYAVWYQYVSGKNAELKELIDALLEKNETFTETINDTLYQKYCVEINADDGKRLGEDLKQMLGSVLGELASMTGKTEKYNTVLTDSVAKLSKNVSTETIKRVLNEILNETKSISGYSHEVQRKLQETTNELETLQSELDRTKIEASVDFLTGVANRKSFTEKLELLTCDAIKENKPLSLLVLDIDHFKVFNDVHGHLIGDEVLKFVAKKIKENVRGRDYIARYGGEEFVVILPYTPLGGAKILAENICQFFTQAKLKVAGQTKPLGRVTLSIGAAAYKYNEALADFVYRADKALYHAKNTGRNKVATEADLSS
jgi:diguanylate cyclase